MVKVLKVVVEPSELVESLLAEVARLNELRLREVETHEDAMRTLVKMLRTRGDIARNANERADNWKKVAIKHGQKMRVLRSKIIHDNRSFLGVAVAQPEALCPRCGNPANHIFNGPIQFDCKHRFHS